MKKMRLLFAGVFLVVQAYSVHAVVIEFTLDDLENGAYQYNYTVTNDDLVAGVGLFDVFFDLGLYVNLVVTNSPGAWDSIIFPPDSNLGADGVFDSEALGSVLALGETLSGFSVSFDWLGAGTPGSQFFEVVDPFTFDFLADGSTTLAEAVPAPVGPGLLLIGLVGCWVSKKRRSLC